MTPPPPRDATVSLANAAATSSSVQSDFTVDDVVLVLVHEREAKRSGNTSSLAPPASRGSSCASRNSIASPPAPVRARANHDVQTKGHGSKVSLEQRRVAEPSGQRVQVGKRRAHADDLQRRRAAAGSRSELAPLSGLPGRFTASGLSSSSLPSAATASPTSGTPKGTHTNSRHRRMTTRPRRASTWSA